MKCLRYAVMVLIVLAAGVIPCIGFAADAPANVESAADTLAADTPAYGAPAADTPAYGALAAAPEPGDIRNRVEVDYVIDEGKCGDNVTYTIYGRRWEWERYDRTDGWVPEHGGEGNAYRATISGTGPMYDYGQSNQINWGEAEVITVESGVTTIGKNFFCYGNRYHFTRVELPNGLKSIGEKAFYWCGVGLESVNIPDTVTYIGPYAFAFSSGIEEINIPEGITTIEENAFLECSSLKSITLPKKVTKIDGCAFRDCPKLRTITLLSKDPPKVKSGFWVRDTKKANKSQTKKMTIKCPNMSKKEKKKFRTYLKKKGYCGNVK